MTRAFRFATSDRDVGGAGTGWGCRLLVVAAVCWISSGGGPDASVQAADQTIDFERAVLPLLREHCLDCHGPETAESNLRLDTMAHALRGGDSGEPAIVPGKSRASYLVTRIEHESADERMPPDSPALSDELIETFKTWIDDAAGWSAAEAQINSQKLEHWAFQPVRRPTPLSNEVAEIDAFVRMRLADAGLEPSPEAPRRKLIRRLFLVMHGLPPIPEQVEAFVNDPHEDAWERLVDEVLLSPRYGERWAAHWLDLVRFGETHGFETNRERPHAWRYRDWVIDAFNSDKPYDQFVREQMAGDAPAAEIGGGGDRAMARDAGIGTSFLVAGPFDQVKGQDAQLRLMQRQDELADIINATGTTFLGLTLGCARCHNHKFDPVTQTDYYALQAVFAGVNHADRPLPLPAEVQARIAAIDAEVATLRKELARFARETSLRPSVNGRENVEQFPPIEVRFVRFTIESTNQGQPCIDELEVFSGEENVALASTGARASSGGDFVHPLHKLEHINDGHYGNPRSWIAAQAKGGWVQIEFPEARSVQQIVWARDREGKYTDRLATEYRIEASLDGADWSLVAGSQDREPFGTSGTDQTTYDFTGVTKTEAAQGRKLLARLEELTAVREQLEKPPLSYAGTFHQPGPTHRLYRGEPGSPRERVAPAGIAALTDLRLPADAPEQQRRLALARWIADEQNPLTARVIVNRLWQFQFGTGIVDTPSDLGANGTPPSHPELLDWLAAELMDSGWSLKHIQRQILLSETWRQESRPRSDGMRVDAASRLLWRFPPRRLEAEAIRDCLLAVTGKLDLRMGGPGFSAFEVEAENVRHYHPKAAFGPEDWRRMIYMTKVRQERDAVFGVFDCPDCSQVTPKRSRSTTPLQALNLLNSRFVQQQADFFARRLDVETGTPEEKVVRAYELCYGRVPDRDEIDAALEFVASTDWRQFARAVLNSNEFVFVP